MAGDPRAMATFFPERPFSPFKGFRPTDLVAHRAYDAVALLLAVGLALLGLLLAWLLFRRRDIAATL